VALVQGNPVALEPYRCGAIVGIVLLAHPSLRRGFLDLEMEHVPKVRLEAIRAHVVVHFAEFPYETDGGQARLFGCLTQCSILGRLSRLDASCWDLESRLLPWLADVSENEEPSRADQVADDLLSLWVRFHSGSLGDAAE
jgi:hypothetical protein